VLPNVESPDFSAKLENPFIRLNFSSTRYKQRLPGISHHFQTVPGIVP